MIFLTINDTDIKERNITKTLNQMNLDQDSENNKIILFSTVHESMFESAYLMFKDNKLFGKGPKLFRIYCDDERYNINDDTCNTHPHNTYVQLAAETGIIGLIFIALIFVSQLSALIKHMYIKIFYKEKSFSDINLCLIICFVISLWPFFPTQNFFNNWINVIYFLPVGFYLYINNNFNGVQEQESD